MRSNVVIHRGQKPIQGDDTGYVGCHDKVSLALPSGTLASYGAPTVARTSGRGHVAEAKTNVIEVSGYRDGHRDDTRLGDPLDFGVFISR